MITGGGQNPLAGIYGMAADHVVALQVVTADGRLRTASEDENTDLFWALRGGGGGTFGVTISVTIRAHPRMDVVTARWALDTSNNDVARFWKGVRRFYDDFLDWADAGLYTFYIMWPLIKSHVSSGKHFLAYHNAPSNAGPEMGNQDNAVNPAFRQMVLFLVTSSNRSADHSTPAALAAQNSYLQDKVLQPWRDIAPVSEGGGTYLNEASVGEPDWQESFYGGFYPRLSDIKRKWDPNDVFYAVTAVGSERWKVQDGGQDGGQGGGQGVPTQNGRLCRV